MFQNEKSEEQKAWEKQEAENIASKLPGQLAVIARRSPADAYRMERMRLDASKWSKRANIPEDYIWEKLEHPMDAEALNNLKASKDKTGIAYIGEFGGSSISQRFQRMAGCMIRHNEDAVVRSLSATLSQVREGTLKEFTALFIPDFFTPKDDGGGLASWQKSALLGLLNDRHLKRKTVVLWLRDAALMSAEYGSSFAQHIMENFLIVSNVADTNTDEEEEEL